MKKLLGLAICAVLIVAISLSPDAPVAIADVSDGVWWIQFSGESATLVLSKGVQWLVMSRAEENEIKIDDRIDSVTMARTEDGWVLRFFLDPGVEAPNVWCC